MFHMNGIFTHYVVVDAPTAAAVVSVRLMRFFSNTSLAVAPSLDRDDTPSLLIPELP